jgi:hypothetical protein
MQRFVGYNSTLIKKLWGKLHLERYFGFTPLSYISVLLLTVSQCVGESHLEEPIQPKRRCVFPGV